ncbi:hypothetical protein KSP39_PZI015086 [Platanthera zijinensis]|uniref:Uncharacterized protein n=1 Tax=Platanthera zijinensis TaxID=2320716 RepID=A0AAP0BB57_9ASPA
MMNLFDLSTTMSGKKKAFGDVCTGDRNRFVVANKATDFTEIHSEDKPVSFESRKGFSGRKSSAKPMKTLIAQEMSKEIDSNRKSPNVVARLMGLDDTIPGDSSVPSAKRTLLQDGGSAQIHAEVSLRSYCNVTKDYGGAYEIRHRESRSNSFNEQVLQKGQHDANQNEKRMAFVREKFVEAKRLATDEKLLDSKEFHDALEVLSCNRDLFLKFLEEPNSLFSSHMEAPHSIPSPQTNRITVLKPSKTKETKSMVKKNQYNTASLCSSLIHRPMTQKLSQPTRIVVLKPNPKKHFDMKSPETPAVSSPGPPERGDFYGGLNTHGSMDSTEAAMDIKLQMRDNQSGHRRDESLLSSVFSNGYVGDDSSFNRSDNYVGGDECNNTDSEISSSWDYTSNRYGSPCSHSSLSRASYSPESSVIREAKKRLSERWALVTSNGLYQEKFPGRRSSSTLGEMLAISELKMEKVNDMEPGASGIRSCGWEDEVEMPATCLSISRMKDENVNESSSGNLSRSKSVPTTSLTYGSMAPSTEDSEFRLATSVVSKETAKSSSGKTSFKGRVSSLFFSKNKKSGRDESVSSPFVNYTDVFQIGGDKIVDHKPDGSSEAIQIHVPEASPAGDFDAESGLISSPVALEVNSDESKPSPKVSLHHEDPGPSTEDHEILRTSEKLNENQDHPSPTSTLDAPFKDDAIENTPISSKFSSCGNPQALSRSPPIESIARTLSWDDSCSKAPSAAPLKLSRAFCEDDPEDLMLVQNLLISSGLCKNSLSTIFNGWHSPDIPLDPKLLEKLPNVNDEVRTNREKKAKQKLIFDFVNTVLRELAHSAEQGGYHRVPGDEALLAGQVWTVVKKKLFEAENGGPVVDRLLGMEVTGSGWTEFMQAQIAEISKEIGVQVLDDLVGEVFVELNVKKMHVMR